MTTNCDKIEWVMTYTADNSLRMYLCDHTAFILSRDFTSTFFVFTMYILYEICLPRNEELNQPLIKRFRKQGLKLQHALIHTILTESGWKQQAMTKQLSKCHPVCISKARLAGRIWSSDNPSVLSERVNPNNLNRRSYLREFLRSQI